MEVGIITQDQGLLNEQITGHREAILVGEGNRWESILWSLIYQNFRQWWIPFTKMKLDPPIIWCWCCGASCTATFARTAWAETSCYRHFRTCSSSGCMAGKRILTSDGLKESVLIPDYTWTQTEATITSSHSRGTFGRAATHQSGATAVGGPKDLKLIPHVNPWAWENESWTIGWLVLW